MKLLDMIISLCVHCVFVASAVIPMTEENGLTNTEKDGSLTSPMDYAMGNLSYMFGWHMAGSALSTNELDMGCNNISSFGHGRWAAEGLVPANIHEPLCNASHANPNATTALPHIVEYSTKLFTTYILNAFAPGNQNASMTYLCRNLRNLMLNGFYFDDSFVINATCQAAGLQPPPRPEGAISAINTNATQAYFNTASILHGLIFALGAPSSLQLNVYCAHAPEYINNLNAETLNGTLVEQTICQITQPIAIGDGANDIRTWISRMFITAIESVSNVDGWLAWLCSNIDKDAMSKVGLDGEAVQTQVCEDARG